MTTITAPEQIIVPRYLVQDGFRIVALADRISDPVPQPVIQLLLEGAYVCQRCQCPPLPELDICPHRQLELDTALTQGLVIALVRQDFVDPNEDRWPRPCAFCFDPIDECFACGLDCDCIDGATCPSCTREGDCLSVEDVLAAALSGKPIIQYRRDLRVDAIQLSFPGY